VLYLREYRGWSELQTSFALLVPLAAALLAAGISAFGLARGRDRGAGRSAEPAPAAVSAPVS
jgi:hypothetical protein